MARENAIASTSTSRTNFRPQSTRSHPVDQSVAADAMEDVDQDEEEEEGEVHTIDDDLDGLSIQTFVEVPVMGTPQTFQRVSRVTWENMSSVTRVRESWTDDIVRRWN
jgi:hypothetical protein